MTDYAITPGGIVVPVEEEKEPEQCALVLTGRQGIVLPEFADGYHGQLRISKGGIEVRLPVTDIQWQKLCQMGIGEWT